ncbi:phosphatase PAP2 family protein [Poritiphilus flavus]|uniref:Phosphatase PAP2 family protein n=1 Tax=Poritiphilus flavus TaxID=2697053 RepID=A0A6L9E9M5_9FLAO|nr:phosphatase PAP2 family protein [Poritiphilus flavus]NAS11248.1 phosphatase PAP2 family protein [Poritiphilus flavus]
MIAKTFLTSLLLLHLSAIAQELHPLEPVQGHYKTLQNLSAEPNPQRADLDAIAFPPSDYSSGTLIYTMVSPEYLTPEQLEELKLSVKFPANSSDQTRAELDFLLEWQEKRGPEQESRSTNVLAPIGYWPHVNLLSDHPRHQENLNNLFYEGRAVFGESCNADNYPKTAKLLEGVTRDMRIMEFTLKYHLLRARPYHLEPELKPLARISSPSFASGHTLWAYIHAFTWSELVPSRRKAFLDLAYEVGESREIMGIHYPSDEEAARVLAHKMLTAMLKNPKFTTDLAAAKAEWK